MNHLEQYDKVCSEISTLLTNRYSTSFSLGIRMFHKELRAPIGSIYGFVRLADEIVDTFHHVDKEKYLNQIIEETKLSIETGFNLNPILHTFGQVVRKYGIEWNHIESFFESMKKDLDKKTFNEIQYRDYIYGSAEVIGLFCLKVFLKNEASKFNDLEAFAKALGSAFQKINFLRDMRSDFEERGRTYFPNIQFHQFSNEAKLEIESDIEGDFKLGKEGINRLPKSSRFGVQVAYTFYYCLFQKIKKTPIDELVTRRIRVSNGEKFFLYAKVRIFSLFSN